METVSSDRCSEHINVERVRVRKVVVPLSGPGGLMGAGESAGKRVDSGTAVPPFTRFLRVAPSSPLVLLLECRNLVAEPREASLR